ncbi:MAG: MATE family efflux transporter [Lachnospiraceae bacterium]|nr:MATE family efflux transporter [Lachnospiraceae bacterium]
MREMKRAIDMTRGKVLTVILSFAMPIFIGNIFQQLYNVVDTVVIGNVLGDDALAAIGASTALFSLTVGITNGMSNGFSVVLARFFGADDEKSFKKAVFSTVVLTVIVSAVLTITGLVMLRPFLLLLGTPVEIMEMATGYMEIIIAFVSVTMLYNTLSGMLRAIGNSIMPLYALMIASVINGILDVILVKVVGMGVMGAAVATVTSEVISVIAIIIYVLKNCQVLHISREDFCFDMGLITELFSTGLSMALMLVLTNIGSVAMQGAVNSFGVKTITGHTAARKIHDICMLPFGTICSAAATFVSQNYGAGNAERIKKGVKITLEIGAVWCVITLAVTMVFGKALITGITGTTSEEVIGTAYRYLVLNVPFYIVLDGLLVMRNCLQGVGKKIVPVCASLTELVGKFVAAFVLAPALGYLGICLIEPITWFVTVPIVAIGFCSVYKELSKAERLEV